MRIGLLGGTFNPVHIGHLVLAHDAAEAESLDRVLLIPCNLPPHKQPTDLADASHRVAMLQRAASGDRLLEVCRLEVERGGISYTVDTLRELRRQMPGADFFLIAGTDCLRELHSWKDVDTLLGLCTLIVFERPGVPMPDPDAIRLQQPWPEKLLSRVRRGHLVEISATEIRQRVAQGLSIRYFVPPLVEEYIRQHGLYGGKGHPE